MRKSLHRHGACLALAVLAASPVIAQDTPITSVRVTAAPKTRGTSAIIHNLRDSPLMAWRLETTPASISTWNCLGDLIRAPNFGPINPHETRTVPLPSVGNGPVEGRITAAVFADGYYEGTPVAVGFFLKERQDRAERLAFWLDAFDRMPSGTEQQKADYLMAKIAESAAASARYDNVGAELRRRLPDRAYLLIATIIDEIRPKIEAALRDTSGPALRAPDGAPSSLTLKVVPSDRVEYVVRIENLRSNATIEGWMLGVRRDAGGSVQPVQGNDASSNDPSTDSRPGPSGRILPHQARSIDLSLPRAEAAARIELAMVLFDDLSFEGSAEVHDRMLDHRARIAEDYGYWLGVYREVAGLPATEAKALLEARRSDRARQKATAGTGPDVSLGSEAIGVLERSPQTFPSWLKRRLREIDAAYARLTRHVGVRAPGLDATASRAKYPAHWWTPVSDRDVPDWEILPQAAGPGEVIVSKRHELGLLSNFAATPFTFRGRRYASVEGFWQMMLYPESRNDPRATFPGLAWPHSRDEVARMTAFEAKAAGTLAEQNMARMGIDWVSFEGRRFPYRPDRPGEHYRLIVDAMREKIRQNPEVKRVLLATGDLRLRPDHHEEPNARDAWRYCDILMALRADLQRERVPDQTPAAAAMVALGATPGR